MLRLCLLLYIYNKVNPLLMRILQVCIFQAALKWRAKLIYWPGIDLHLIMKVLHKTTVPEYFESTKFSATKDDPWGSSHLKDLTHLSLQRFYWSRVQFHAGEQHLQQLSEPWDHSGYHRVQEQHQRQHPNGPLQVQHFCSKIKFIKWLTVRDLFFQLSGKADFMV